MSFDEPSHPFGELLGLEFTEVREGFSRCELEVADSLLNPHGVLHGGVLYSLADTGMGAALYPSLEASQTCATVDVTIRYLQAVRSGRVVCETEVVHLGGRLATLRSELRRDGEIVATATGTYSIGRGS